MGCQCNEDFKDHLVLIGDQTLDNVVAFRKSGPKMSVKATKSIFGVIFLLDFKNRI